MEETEAQGEWVIAWGCTSGQCLDPGDLAQYPALLRPAMSSLSLILPQKLLEGSGRVIHSAYSALCHLGIQETKLIEHPHFLVDALFMRFSPSVMVGGREV